MEPTQKLGDVYIGNDVWIGTDVMLLGGCKIGDGVVIGAKSLVTSNQDLKTTECMAEFQPSCCVIDFRRNYKGAEKSEMVN